MARSLRYLVFFLLILLAFGGGAWLMRYYYQLQQPNAMEEGTVLLEQINKVAKLITVEGEFSELYTYKDYLYYDISPLRKKALLRVKAKVSVGYDLSNMTIVPDYETRTFYISDIPDPEILSIDHEVSYYDIEEGVFNYFDERGQTKLVEDAKAFLRKKAEESRLFEAATEQGVELLDLIKFMAESTGWTVEMRSVYDEPVPAMTN